MISRNFLSVIAFYSTFLHCEKNTEISSLCILYTVWNLTIFCYLEFLASGRQLLKILFFFCFSTEIPEDEDYQSCFRNFSYTDPNFWWLFLAPKSIWRKFFLCEIIGKFYQFLIVSLSKEIILIWLQNSLMY